MQHTSEEPLSLEELFTRIATGQAVIQTNDNDIIIVKDPSVREKQMADIIYKQEFKRLIDVNVPTKYELLQQLEATGLWSPEDTHLEEVLPKELMVIKQEINNCQFRSVTKSSLIKKKERFESQLRQISHKKESIFHISAEYLANNIKHHYLIYKLSFDVNNQPYFACDTFQEFLASFISEANQILEHGFYPRNITESDIRKLARNEPWRSVWVAAQKTGNLFGKPLIEITDLQRALVTWSLIYDAARESSNCPDAAVFEDDSLFDGWLTSQSKGQGRSDNKDYGPKVLKHSDLTEVGIMVESPEDARRVYEMNSAATNSNIRQNQKIISEKGEIQAGYLPEVQRLLRQKATQQAGANK